MRRCHILKGNKNNESVHDAIWVDTETIPNIQPDGSEQHFLEFGWACYRRRTRNGKWTAPDWFRFTSIDEFWAWTLSKLHGKTKLYMFAHNWGFDAPVLDVFSKLPKHGYILTGSVINSPPVILKWRNKPHTIMMIDTLNIWRMPLKSLGKSIGLDKLEMPERGESVEKWDTYGKRDTEIIMVACLAWWDFLIQNDLGGFAATLAAQAVRTYRHRFMHHEILIDDNEKALALARETLHGGRTECFYIGKVKHKVYKLDINSQYPSVMATEFMPRKLIGHYRNVTLDECVRYVKKYCLSVECTITTTEPVFPIIHDKKLVFPVGTFTAFLSTPEIAYALKHKMIGKIIQCNIYERDILFKEYIEYFYKLRTQYKTDGDEVRSLLCKLLMNSLYGKFAQRGLVFEKEQDTDSLNIKVWTEIDAETLESTSYRQYAKIIEKLTKETESRDSHPAIAAHITAHARIQLWGLMRGAGQGNYVYCDTDSLWVNKVGYDNLIEHCDDTQLGKLKLEGVHDDVRIYGCKDYEIDGTKRIKGIRANAEQVGSNAYRQDRFSTLVGLLRTGNLSAPVITKITKNLGRNYTKGVVEKNGRVSPLRFPLRDCTGSNY